MSDGFKGLKLYNTLSRSKEEFRPLDASNVRLYVCGPTVYDFAHIGNARPVIVFDVLFRLLRFFYGAGQVTYVRNITDVDDKINKRAFERWNRTRTLTEEIRAVTEGTLAQFREDVADLGTLPPSYEPRATDFIARSDGTLDMIQLVQRLLARGHAYEAEGHVLFDVGSMGDYGALSRKPKDDLIAGARVEVAPYKRDPQDFVLWKPSNRETEPGWESPFGYGRPGWHLECSAMAGNLLGEVFDIHAGGLDLIFPHHENEIAQTRCAFGTASMAQVWMHNGFLQAEGEKMSKSLGNFSTIREVLDEWPGEVARLTMLKTHYRQPIDWTRLSLEESTRTLRGWAELVAGAAPGGTPDAEFLATLSDDLNMAGALSELHRLAFKAKKGDAAAAVALKASLALIGFRLEHVSETAAKTGEEVDRETVVRLVEDRLAARAFKNWAESDRIRDVLIGMGISIKDNKDGTTTWETRR
jgi:cysteinyl-tRNA synthetase